MKRFFHLLCATALVGCGQTQILPEKQTELEKLNLKGKVFSVELKSYMDGSTFNTPGENAEGILDQYLEFNEAGNLVLKKEFNDGGLVLTDTFLYNSQGQLLESRTVRWFTNVQVPTTILRKVQYNNQGQETQNFITHIAGLGASSDTVTSQSEFIYNDAGQLVRINHKNGERLDAFNEFTYHGNGRLKSNRYFNEHFHSEFITRYNENGKHIEKSLVGHTKTTFSYNAQGDPETITLSLPAVTFACTYTYDAQGNWIRQEQVPDNTSYPHSHYTLVRNITYR